MNDSEFKKNKNQSVAGRHVYILLDRSGSMSNGWDETLGSINGYVKELEDDIQVSLYAFDNLGFDTIRSTKAGLWEDVTDFEVTPRGGTPLYDSAGRVMDIMLENNASRSLFVVMTDGYENYSKEYDLNAVKGKLKLLENREWPVVFLGANFKDVSQYATSTFGVSMGQTVNMSNRIRASGMSIMAGKTQSYMNTGQAATMDWSETEKEELDKS